MEGELLVVKNQYIGSIENVIQVNYNNYVFCLECGRQKQPYKGEIIIQK